MAEELAFQQGLGEGRAVDRHEGAGAVDRRGLMEGPRQLLLAGAGLALDQHGGRGLRHVANQLEDLEHLRALAHDVHKLVAFHELSAQRDQLVLERPLLKGAFHQQAEMLRVGGLGEEVVGAQPHRLDRLGDAAMTGRDDHGHRQPALLDFLDQFHAAETRHAQVGDDQAIGMRTLGQLLEGITAVDGQIDRDAQREFEKLLKRGPGVFAVLDDQNALLDGKRGLRQTGLPVLRHGRFGLDQERHDA